MKIFKVKYGNKIDSESIETTYLLKVVYPVGSIYMSINSTNPSNLFGGTWEQLKDRFLLGAGTTYSNGATGGEATHTLTINEMPKHTHNLRSNYTAGGPYATPVFDFNEGHSSEDGNAVLSAGGGQAHNNMPPYLAVYMWKRIA